MLRSLLLVAGFAMAVMIPTAYAHADSSEDVVIQLRGEECRTCTSSRLTLMKISRTLRTVDGVQKVRINMATNQIVAKYDPAEVTSTELGIVLEDMGFSATRYAGPAQAGTTIAKK